MSVSVRGHPPGAYLLVFTELLERFSYYGMRGLLILFMTRPLAEGGLAWSDAPAIAFFGLFGSLIWFAPIFGGYVADRWLGQRLSVLLGGISMAAGHFSLVATTFLPSAAQAAAGEAATHGLGLGQPYPSATQDGIIAGVGDPSSLTAIIFSAQLLFLGGLGLIVVGNGLLKPNITVMLGTLYPRNDPRRDTAYTLFYIGISAGAFLAALTAGTTGETLGWRYGFVICGAVMLGGILFYALRARALLGEIGCGPAPVELVDSTNPGGSAVAGWRAALYIALLSLFATIFWTGYEQSGGLLNLYVYEKVDRSLFGMTIPATWLLTLPALFCILIGVFVATTLERVERRGTRLDPPRRFAIGLLIGAMAFALIGTAAWTAGGSAMSLGWIVAFYLLLTIAELVLSPSGFAMVTRIAPAHLASRMMGLWLLSVALGSALAGQVGALSAGLPIHFILFGLAIAFVIAAALLLLVRRPLARVVGND